MFAGKVEMEAVQHVAPSVEDDGPFGWWVGRRRDVGPAPNAVVGRIEEEFDRMTIVAQHKI
jgi:hypothetical protein